MNTQTVVNTDDSNVLSLNKTQREELRTHRLSERGLLLRVSAPRFNNSRPDMEATDEVCASKKASKRSVGVRKTLLPKIYLQKATVPYNQLREIVRRRLLPWDGTGWAFCPIGIYDSVMAEITAKANELKNAVAEMGRDWDQMMDEIEHMCQSGEHLGDLFDRAEFPTADEFINTWGVEIEKMQVPSTDIRVAMDDASAADLEKQIAKMLAKNASAAWSKAAQDLADAVSHVSEILNDTGDGKKRKSSVHDTLLENLQVQLDTVLAMADTINDPALRKVAEEVKRDLLAIPADTLRRNPDIRKRVGAKARALVSRTRTEAVANEQKVDDLMDELQDFASFMSDK